MADPITAGISLALSAGSGIIGAFGAAQKDDAATAMYNYKAGVAQANAQIAAQNATYAIQAGGVQRQQEGQKGQQVLGQEKVAQAGSGFDVNTGTATGVRESQTKAIQQGEDIITNEAARKAYGYGIEGMNATAEARLDTMAGQQAQEQKGWDVASSLLGGASSVSDKWMKYSKAGVFS